MSEESYPWPAHPTARDTPEVTVDWRALLAPNTLLLQWVDTPVFFNYCPSQRCGWLFLKWGMDWTGRCGHQLVIVECIPARVAAIPNFRFSSFAGRWSVVGVASSTRRRRGWSDVTPATSGKTHQRRWRHELTSSEHGWSRRVQCTGQQ